MVLLAMPSDYCRVACHRHLVQPEGCGLSSRLNHNSSNSCLPGFPFNTLYFRQFYDARQGILKKAGSQEQSERSFEN
jgi:hypothetical protein